MKNLFSIFLLIVTLLIPFNSFSTPFYNNGYNELTSGISSVDGMLIWDVSDNGTYANGVLKWVKPTTLWTDYFKTAADLLYHPLWDYDYTDLINKPTIPTASDTAYDATSWDANTDVPTKNAVRDKIESLSGGHAAVTLDANVQAMLTLTTQEIGFQTQTANYIFAGPTSGAAAIPTFRALVPTDIPDLSATYEAADSAIVKSDENETITGTWTFSGTINLGPLTFADATTAPSAVGEMRYVNNGLSFTDGAIGWYDDDEVAYLIDTRLVDDTAGGTNALTNRPPSSNALYDVAQAKLNISDIDDTPVDSETAAPISSNWAHDHAADKIAHGGTATASKSAAYTIGTDDADEAYGGTIYVTSAATITAPAVTAGMQFTVVTIGAIAVSLDVNASDKMYLDGTLLDDGDKATNTSTTGDIITCAYYSADGWYCASGSPDGDHWTDTGD